VQRSEEIIIATSSGYFRNLKEPTVFMKASGYEGN
jgi:hypothetical protein